MKKTRASKVAVENDTITVNSDSRLTEASRPANLFTRLILRSDIEAPGVFSESSALALNEFTQLTSLTIDKVSLLGCTEISVAHSLGEALAKMPRLRVLRLDTIFGILDGAKAINIALRNIIGFVLLRCESLEVLELNHCYPDLWEDSTWEALAEASSILKLKKLAFRNDNPTDTFVDISNVIRAYSDLEACEVVFGNDQSLNRITTWNDLGRVVMPNKQLKSLEVGSFDLTKEDDRVVLSEMMSQCQSLVSFGLHCVNFSTESLDHLFSLFSTNCTFSQLILDVDEIIGCDFVEFTQKVLEATVINQICLRHNGEDVTPEEVSRLCDARIHDQLVPFESVVIGKTEECELIESLEKIIAGLHTELSSRPLSQHQLHALYQAAIEMDNLQHQDALSNVKAFFNFLRCYFEEGKVQVQHVENFAGFILQRHPNLMSEFYQTLGCVFPVVGPVRINEHFGDMFIEMMRSSYSQFEIAVSSVVREGLQSKTQAREILAKISSHIDVLEKPICKVLLGDELPRLLIEINVLRDVLFQGLENRPKYVELCVKKQVKAFEADNHLQGFDAWFLRGCKTYSLHNGRLEPFIQYIVTQIKKPEFLNMMAHSLFVLRPDFEENSEKMDRLHFALAILSQAILLGDSDESGLYRDIQQSAVALHNEMNAGEEFVEADLEKIIEPCREGVFSTHNKDSGQELFSKGHKTTLLSSMYSEDDASSIVEDQQGGTPSTEGGDELLGTESGAMYGEYFGETPNEQPPASPPVERRNIWAGFAGFRRHEKELHSSSSQWGNRDYGSKL